MPTLQAFEEEPHRPSVQELVKRLSQKDPAAKKIAALQLQEMGEEGVTELLKVMAEEEETRKRRRKGALIGAICFFLFITVMAIVFRSGIFISFSGMASTMLVTAYAATQTQRDVAKQLTLVEDVRVVGHLAAALEYNNKALAEQAAEALIRLLPKMNASDAPYINAEQRKCLYRVLQKPKLRPALTLATLKAMEQIGDAAAYPIVKRIAEEKEFAKFAFYAAAQDCLPYLENLAAQAENRETLLRPSGLSEASPETLLRPVESNSETPPDQLLRPGSAPS